MINIDLRSLNIGDTLLLREFDDEIYFIDQITELAPKLIYDSGFYFRTKYLDFDLTNFHEIIAVNGIIINPGRVMVPNLKAFYLNEK